MPEVSAAVRPSNTNSNPPIPTTRLSFPRSSYEAKQTPTCIPTTDAEMTLATTAGPLLLPLPAAASSVTAELKSAL
jgi:hypothetical protein